MPAEPATACFTFDNLGEAAELGEGAWPEGEPLGRHFTVEVVPRLLDLLDRHGVEATFFVEAFNAAVYPELLREIADRGHEVACHAWQHEHWGRLSPERERELLVRSTEALGDLGLRPVGLRPPGGQVTARTPELLRELGYAYYSPAGSRAGVADGLAVLPFEWRCVDAFYYAPPLAGLRERAGLGSAPLPPGRLAERIGAALRETAAGGGTLTLIFHPMFLDGAQALAGLEGVIETATALAAAGALECSRARDAAARMLAAPDRFGAPAVDSSTWT